MEVCAQHGTAALTRRSGNAIPSLTGIRGVAAFYVFLTHAQIVLAAYLASPVIAANGFMRNGFRGVDLFFVLSGFILMHVHEGDFGQIRWAATRDFYVLRFFRVVPVNTLLLLALVLLALLLPAFVGWTRHAHGVAVRYHEHDFSRAGFVQSLLLAQTWSIVKPGQWNAPAWSLSAELFGYALFPLLATLALRCRSAVLAAAAAVGSLLLLIAAMRACGHATDNPTGPFGLVRMMFCFTAGIALSRCSRCWPEGARWASAITVASAGWILLALVWAPLNLFVLLGFGGIILGLTYGRGPVDRALASRPALFLGRISFSFYMVHYIPLQLALWLLDTRLAGSPLAVRVAIVSALFAACVGAAVALQRWWEVPTQRLGRRVLRHLRATDLARQAGRPHRPSTPEAKRTPGLLAQ